MEEEDRPSFRITSKQQEAFDQVIDAVDVIVQIEAGSQEQEGAKQKLETAVLELCIALLDDQLGDHQYQSVIISGLAVLGLQEGGRWADAEDYTPKLSAVIKLARLMAI